ncbi:MAG TPA: MFS transporter [Jiangellaceae bacterium]|nr:MFS transporter [Jiangellaceae bacterium]
MTPALRSPTDGGLPALLRARSAVAAVFALNGLAMANWISRVPAIRDELGLTPGDVGLLLLAMSAGAVLALPSAGAIVLRIGPARTVAAGGIAACTGMLVVGVGGGAVSTAMVAAGLFAFGSGAGVWDVAMNVEGADVERCLERTIMPRFHAAFSLGTVAGAGTGALAAAADVPLDIHLTAAAALILAGVLMSARFFTPVAPAAKPADTADRRHPLAAWREPRTLLIGLMVLAAALVEGTANDWLALALVDGYGTSHAVGAVGFGVFVAAMTVGRISGTSLLDRFGRVVVLRSCTGLAIVGVMVFVLGGSLALALAGTALWGLGASLGFPVGMSAASDEQRYAAARVSVVASIGYTAFLAGPPLIGLLGDRVGVLRALLVILVALVLSLAVTGAARPLPVVAATRD